MSGNKIVSLVVALLLAGCGAVESAYNCDTICNRYKDCFNSDYDTGVCAQRCRDAAADDSDYQRKANQCEACIDDRSCTSATFNCTLECGTIVP